MCHVHHAQPFIAHRLERSNPVAHAIHQDFAAAAGNRAKPRLHEIADDLLDWFVEKLLECDELAWTEAMNVDLRKLAFDVREQIEIPPLAQLWVMPALH